ncbi:MAG: flagellar hook capping FlgD N-terminal domain-containing protein [Planctomycetota bacterium]
MPVTATQPVGANAASPSAPSARGAAGLGSDDFFKLLITQLTNQDPMKPTDNEELLRQIASIREIELSSTLTDSLRSLTGQQSFTSASALLGQHVTGTPGEDGLVSTGMVLGVRFGEGGQVVLQLSNGSELPLSQVALIQSPQSAAEALLGKTVAGLDLADPKEPKLLEGVVAGVSAENGEVTLELDTGERLPLRNVMQVQE